MTQKRFTADITVDIDPEYIDDFFSLVADAAESYSGILAQYRYFVQKIIPMNSMEIYDYLIDNLELPDDANTQYIADEIYYRLDYSPMYHQIDELAHVLKNN